MLQLIYSALVLPIVFGSPVYPKRDNATICVALAGMGKCKSAADALYSYLDLEDSAHIRMAKTCGLLHTVLECYISLAPDPNRPYHHSRCPDVSLEDIQNTRAYRIEKRRLNALTRFVPDCASVTLNKNI